MTVQLPLAFQLPDNMSLESFIPGKNEEILHAVKQLVQAPAEHLLFISGPGQSGKTHLASALCVAATKAGLNCAYLPLNELAQLDPNALQDLHQLDLVCIDDVQAVAGKPEWEEALFVLFNQARENNSRLLFTADQGPGSLPLELADLKSRLSWGVSYKLEPLADEAAWPDPETGRGQLYPVQIQQGHPRPADSPRSTGPGFHGCAAQADPALRAPAVANVGRVLPTWM